MNIKNKAKNFYNDCYHKPINEKELIEFAEIVLNEFVNKLEKNMTSAVCNGDIYTVLFKDRKLKNIKNLNEIKKEFYV